MQEDMQGQLIPAPATNDGESALPVVARGDSRICTAARLRARRPADYARAVSLLAEGVPVFRIANLLSVSVNTIYAVRRAESAEVERSKIIVADKLADLADLAADQAARRLGEEPDGISYKDLMVGLGIAVDKSLLLSGGAPARIELSRDDVPGYDLLLQEASAIDLSGRGSGQKELGGLEPSREDMGGLEPGGMEAPPDAQSSGEHC